MFWGQNKCLEASALQCSNIDGARHCLRHDLLVSSGFIQLREKHRTCVRTFRKASPDHIYSLDIFQAQHPRDTISNTSFSFPFPCGKAVKFIANWGQAAAHPQRPLVAAMKLYEVSQGRM